MKKKKVKIISGNTGYSVIEKADPMKEVKKSVVVVHLTKHF